MTNIFEVDSVVLEFSGRKVLQDVYLKVETGKVTGILGRNGVGKSCLMKIMFGELQSLDSSVRVNGIALLGSKRSPQDIRYLPQSGFIPKSLTVKSVFSDFETDFADFISHFPSFKDLYNKRIGELSGGEQRVIALFVILTSNTKFCILDEPFSQIMPLHIDTIKSLIKRESKNKGILISDHMYKHIIKVCESIYVVKDGKTHLTKSVNDLETLGYVRTM